MHDLVLSGFNLRTCKIISFSCNNIIGKIKNQYDNNYCYSKETLFMLKLTMTPGLRFPLIIIGIDFKYIIIIKGLEPI